MDVRLLFSPCTKDILAESRYLTVSGSGNGDHFDNVAFRLSVECHDPPSIRGLSYLSISEVYVIRT